MLTLILLFTLFLIMSLSDNIISMMGIAGIPVCNKLSGPIHCQMDPLSFEHQLLLTPGSKVNL